MPSTLTVPPSVVLAAGATAPAWVAYTGLCVAALSACAVVANFVVTRYQASKQEKRQYADYVAAWTGPAVTGCEGIEGYHFHTVIVHNGSEQPVYDAVVLIDMSERAEMMEGEEPLAVLAVGLVPPKERVEKEIDCSGQLDPFFPAPLAVAFTDVRAVKWERDIEGKLSRVKPERGVLPAEEAQAEGNS
ncbi:hypothetical protein [Streptomyces sp. RKAG293]|uniref:hypothetical protein n=1 Tax=Streptomyces sp. RKAG293 TaxID=2893403 RepID=UPI00203372DD|nr:hypothetical protein [Streptomyces sp. RKAG293]MCM2424294.1 hypothetical protein [Streptomyces sp. RKAG293]